MSVDASRISLLLETWGKWVADTRPFDSSELVSGAYIKRETPLGAEIEQDDIPMLIDRAVAALPMVYMPVRGALLSRYVFRKSNYQGAQYMKTGETYFRSLIQQGQSWVYGYLMAHCPRNNGPLFELLNDDPERVAPPKVVEV